ncbi:hypothetical protein KCP69_25815 [Salmonella enterica subsp. enterica]|nr:hypothetical protein KCP69_25815 [Salmonella enterica subsp. enterica]
MRRTRASPRESGTPALYRSAIPSRAGARDGIRDTGVVSITPPLSAKRQRACSKEIRYG